MDFDIVIPLGPNDVSLVNEQLKYTKKNIVGFRKIFIVTFSTQISLLEEHCDCILVDETMFPFQKQDVQDLFIPNSPRIGWYYQQLLKLYAGSVIPTILDNYLVIDADTFFLQPTTFFEDGKPLYVTATEYHHVYFVHMKKMEDSLKRMDPRLSGVCHHMLFQNKFLHELFAKVEKDNPNNPNQLCFWRHFLQCVDPKEMGRFGSGASEYEIYFNFLLQYHSDAIQVRPLIWKNCAYLQPSDPETYSFASCHYWQRGIPR